MEKYVGTISPTIPCAFSDWPTMQRAATFASGRPVAFDTYGTVRDARGFTSSTKTVPFWIANWTFISPTTDSPCAIATVCRRSSSCVCADSENGGKEHAESPEWTPACSMCSMMPPMTTSVPSQSASTSTSIEFSMKRSRKISPPE